MELMTPVGRLVQGGVTLQHQKNMQNQLSFNADGTPEMGIVTVLAFPKVLPTGMPNTEFDAFRAQLNQVAAAAWPQFFPQGPMGPCINPKFSWKIQDGDGVDTNGISVADKPGFKGHWVVRFYTAYPFGCFMEGKFQAHEVLQKPEDVVKRGHWVRMFVEVKSNNADLTKQQVPGIALYPKLLSYVQAGEAIQGGPDAAAAFGAAPVGYVPPAPAGSPIPTPGAAALPPPPVVAAPIPLPPPVAAVVIPPPPVTQQEQYTPTAAMPAGVTIAGLLGNGWTYDAIVAQGYAVKNY